MDTQKILVCDDDADIVAAIRIYLTGEGYEVFSAQNGKEALEMVEKEAPKLLILDVMMPVMDGITAMTKLREFSNIPVILLTAKSEDTDKVLGLGLGADDYITKPFNPVELIARVRSALRRYLLLGGSAKPAEENEHRCMVGGIELNDDSKQVWLDGEEISLTPTEYDILLLLMQNVGKVFSPREIYEKVWKGDALGSEGTVAVHIRHLREKIEYDPANPRHLIVVWGRGYKLCETGETQGGEKG